MADVFHIRRAMRHLPGVGPSRMDDFLRRGLHDWGDLLREYRGLGLPGKHARLVETLEAGEAALTRGDIRHFTETLHRADHWRILADFFDRATFLDIETSGDELRPEITTIIAKHAGRLHIFTAERNLDDFLHLLDDITFWVTFNGASFDVPQLENHFHIPMRDIAHVDLRWVCYHAQLRGGLKEIERAIGLTRPPDLIGMDGAEADWLWRRWKHTGNEKLVQRLVRYCAADVVGLELLSRWLVAQHTNGSAPAFIWEGLPDAEPVAAPLAPAYPAPEPARPALEGGLEKRLRERLRAMRAARAEP
ncbi:MAG: ribonuclease H-like domain-containing protein [Kiritimatiellia bacterium]